MAAPSARLALAAAATLLPLLPVAAQPSGSRQTRDFVQAASQSDTFEILEAQTAVVASADPDIQAFARQMIRDHQGTRDALSAAAARSRLQPPAPGIAGDQAMFLAALQSLRGAEFDRAYARQQMLAHRGALAVEQGYAGAGDDPNVRQAAASAVPLIQGHEQMAAQLTRKFGGS